VNVRVGPDVSVTLLVGVAVCVRVSVTVAVADGVCVGGNVRVGVRVGKDDVGSGVSVGPDGLVDVGVADSSEVGVKVADSVVPGLGVSVGRETVGDDTVADDVAVAVANTGVGVSATSVLLGVVEADCVGVEVGTSVSSAEGVTLGVTAVALPIALATAGKSAADSVSSTLTSASAQVVPSNKASFTAPASAWLTTASQFASPVSWATAGMARTLKSTSARTVSASFAHLRSESSGALRDLCIPTPTRAHHQHVPGDNRVCNSPKVYGEDFVRHGVGVGVATRITICAVGPVRPDTSASLAVTTLSPALNAAVAATMSQNCSVACGLMVCGSRVWSMRVHADEGENTWNRQPKSWIAATVKGTFTSNDGDPMAGTPPPPALGDPVSQTAVLPFPSGNVVCTWTEGRSVGLTTSVCDPTFSPLSPVFPSRTRMN